MKIVAGISPTPLTIAVRKAARKQSFLSFVGDIGVTLTQSPQYSGTGHFIFLGSDTPMEGVLRTSLANI